jgi:phytoene synthase
VARDTSFYYSFLVLPPEKRRALIAVWDFCRAVDDSVDEAAGTTDGQAAKELARWRSELARCFDRQPPETPQGRALQPLIDRFTLPRPAFEALIDGVEMDLYPRRYATFAELYEYCTRVASAVGLMCIEIFGYRNPTTREYAIELGVALQLTNILRDVPGDLTQGRLYLPLEDLQRYGCSEDDLKEEIARAGGGVQAPAVKSLLASQAVRARQYYARANTALPQEDRRRMVAAEIMGAIYRGILSRIEAAHYDVFSQLIRVPRRERAMIAARVWLRTLAGF